MKTPKYIKPSNLPPRVGVLGPLCWWLILERFNAPGWLFGVVFTVLGIVLVAEIVRLFAGESVDLLRGE